MSEFLGLVWAWVATWSPAELIVLGVLAGLVLGFPAFHAWCRSRER